MQSKEDIIKYIDEERARFRKELIEELGDGDLKDFVIKKLAELKSATKETATTIYIMQMNKAKELLNETNK